MNIVKRFSFVPAEKPVFEVVLGDEAKTVLHIQFPTKAGYERIESIQKRIEDQVDGSFSELSEMLYSLAVEIMSCNVENITFNADELREKYNVSLGYLQAFFEAYTDFINGVIAENSKN